MRGGSAGLRSSVVYVADDVALSALQTELLAFITNAAEPTWIMVAEMPELGGDRDLAERELAVLQARGLVTSTREVSGDPQRPYAPDEWWSLTTAGWDAIGLTKPSRYH